MQLRGSLKILIIHMYSQCAKPHKHALRLVTPFVVRIRPLIHVLSSEKPPSHLVDPNAGNSKVVLLDFYSSLRRIPAVQDPRRHSCLCTTPQDDNLMRHPVKVH
jgi:hypothetical protein